MKCEREKIVRRWRRRIFAAGFASHGEGPLAEFERGKEVLGLEES